MSAVKHLMIILSIAILFSNCHQKPTLTSGLNSTSTRLIDAFFQKLKDGNYKSGIEELLNSNHNIDLKDSATFNLLKSFEYINSSSGKYITSKEIRQRKLEEDIAVYSYLVKYETKFYRFIFVFYNNDQEIALYKFSFDDNLSLELEESIKLYGDKLR